MGHYDANRNQYLPGEDVTLLPAAARVATVTSPVVACAAYSDAELTLAITAVGAGTPTLDVSVETREYTGAWVAIGTFPQQTGVASLRRAFHGVREELRAVATIGGGTPSLTFSLVGYLK